MTISWTIFICLLKWDLSVNVYKLSFQNNLPNKAATKRILQQFFIWFFFQKLYEYSSDDL